MSEFETESESKNKPPSHRRLYIAVMVVALVALIAGSLVLIPSSKKTAASVPPYYISNGIKHFTTIPLVNRGFSLDQTNEQVQLGSCLKAFRKFQTSSATAQPSVAPSSLSDQIAFIAQGVSRARGLDFKSVPVPEFVSGSEMQKRIDGTFASDASTGVKNTEDELALLTLIPASTDLASIFKNAYSSQVLGYYDSKSKKLVVLSGNKSLSTDDQFVLSHELDHALTDQALGLPDDNTGNAEADGAAQSLTEGDATFLMQLYAISNFSKDQIETLGDASGSTELNESEFGDAPAIVENTISFPYSEGLNFICARYNTDGWDGVNYAYKHLPKTSLEIMFPSRYGKVFTSPKLNFKVPKNWSKKDSGAFGASDLYQMLAYPNNNPKRGLADARNRSQAWNGGTYALWKNGTKQALGVAIKQQPNTPDLCESIAAWASTAFPSSRSTSSNITLVRANKSNTFALRCSTSAVRFVIAPTMNDVNTFFDKA